MLKKIIVIFVCMLFLLSAGVTAGERECYKLEKGAMGFISVLHINQFVELVPSKGNIATEYFNDLVSRKLAFQTNKDLIVYKFDHFYATGKVDVFRVKLQNETIVELIDTTAGTIRSVKLQAGSTLGWVFGLDLKRTKQK